MTPPTLMQSSDQDGKFQAITKFLSETEAYLEKLAKRLKQLKARF